MKNTIFMIATVILCLMLTSCGKVFKYDTEDAVEVNLSGANGEGTLSAYLNRNVIYDNINRDIYDGKGTDLQLARYELEIYDSISIDADKKEGLSNGDVVNITLKSDNARLKDMHVGFKENVYQYTVEGLQDYEHIDPFEELDVRFEGASPNGSVVIEYTGNDFIKDNVTFFPDKSNLLANGDTVKITASAFQNVLDENFVKLDQTEKEYTVSGLDEYLHEEFDTTEIDKAFDVYIQNYIDSNRKIGAKVSGDYFFDDAYGTFNEYTVKAQHIEPVKSYLNYVKADSYNYYYNRYKRFYKVSFDVEKTGYTDSFWGSTFSDGREIGFTGKSDTRWVVVYIENIMKKGDGTLEYSLDDKSIHYNAYSWDLFNDYRNADLDTIVEAEVNEATEIVFEK